MTDNNPKTDAPRWEPVGEFKIRTPEGEVAIAVQFGGYEEAKVIRDAIIADHEAVTLMKEALEMIKDGDDPRAGAIASYALDRCESPAPTTDAEGEGR